MGGFNSKIVSICREKDGILVTYKDRKENILAFPNLNLLPESRIKENVVAVTLNNRNNLETLYAKWSIFKNIQQFKIYFINPFSTTDRKWVINPHVHAKICDSTSLKIGLKAMFETVEPLTPELLEAKIKEKV